MSNAPSLIEREANLSPAKRALLERLKRGVKTVAEPETGVVRRTDDEPAPLSFSQERLWFLEQLEPGKPTFNMPVVLRMRGDVNLDALRRTLDEILNRHEILRTVIVPGDSHPMQVVTAFRPLELKIEDLRALAEHAKEPEALRLAKREAEKPFDLTRDAMLRARLIRLSETDHLLCVTMHHIASDGWSVGVLVSEFSTLYEAFGQGKPSPLPRLPFQYADFAAHQRQTAGNERAQRELKYWTDRLRGPLPFLELPTDRPRPKVQTHNGDTARFTIDATVTNTLKTLSRDEGATLYMTLLAAFQTLLHRYTEQEDILVGTSVAGRQTPETEGLIGFFLNTLVMRTDLSGSPSFRELLARVKETTLEAFANQTVPVERLMEALRPERELAFNPLFQTLFIFQNMPKARFELPGMTISLLPVENKTAKFDLTLTMEEDGHALAGELEYNTDLFDAETVERLIGHFKRLLRGVAENPDARISEASLLSEEELRFLLKSEHSHDRADHPETFIHKAVEYQSELTPDAVAVETETDAITYRELNRAANRLARRLIRLGVGPDSLVGLCSDRSIDMVVGLLGILKAGGVYVPLDPNYPKDRLETILEDADIRLLITKERLANLFPTSGNLLFVLTDADPTFLTDVGDDDPEIEVSPENLAYVMYTSGSTGKPKGVMASHGALARYVESVSREFDLTVRDRVLQFASLNFDAAVEEIFPTLACGARLSLRSDAMSESVPTFLDVCRRRKLTILDLPTAFWHQLVAEMEADRERLPESVRLVVIGGEKALPERIAQWYRLVSPDVRLLNTYGPTETTVVATLHEVRPEDVAGAEPRDVPIGVALPEVQAYVLDKHLQPVPVGVPGELHIAGGGLTRGYLNRPHLTAERFVPNPFSSEPGARMYKTGDRVRRLRNGKLEYLGRIDGQVKIRGFRIELGEIEAALVQHPEIKEAVAVDVELSPGDKRLVAYIVSVPPAVAGGFTAKDEKEVGTVSGSGWVSSENSSLITHHSSQSPNSSFIVHPSSFLRKLLPEYMLPWAFVEVESIPRTPNGKLDRRSLPLPESIQVETETPFIEPRTETERRLGDIWKEVLKVQRVGVRDNFFELGGHSLLAARVVSHIRRDFQVELPLLNIFESPTVEALAAKIEAFGVAARETTAIRRIESDADLPLSFAQERLWFLDQLDPGNSTYNIAFTVRLIGRLDVAALQRGLNEIVRRHETLRTVFTVRDGRPVQTISPAFDIELPVADLSLLPPSVRERAMHNTAVSEANRGFDLSKGPLIRASLLVCGRDENLLLLTMHHIVSDDWSMGVFINELTESYRAFLTETEPNLPELPVRYVDYAARQREALTGERLEKELDYWKTKLAGPPPSVTFPTDRPRPAVHTHNGGSHRFSLSPAVAEAAVALSRREDATLFMTLLAAFQTLLHRHTNQPDVTVGTPVAGRNIAEIENLIGFFINTLAVRTDLSGNPSFRNLLGRVRRTMLEALAHQETPFEKVVDAVQPERDMSRSPLFQTMLVLQNAPMSEIQLPGLELRPAGHFAAHAKFDLTVMMWEEAGGLHGLVEYNSDLYDASTVERLTEHFGVLLEAAVSSPETEIEALPLLSADERRTMLRDWNDTATTRPVGCIHKRFEAQVAQTPDATALEFEGEKLTYAELNAQANRLARKLRELGVGPELPVGIRLERSIETVVSLLAVIKAGGCAVALDTAYPKDRLVHMIAEAGMPVLLTQERLVETLPEHQAVILRLDADAPSWAGESPENLDVEVFDDNLLYLIFTSGSTGQPKAIGMPHRAFANLLDWQNAHPDLSKPSRIVQFSTFGFCVSFQEIFTALTAGGTIVLLPEDLKRDLAGLAAFLDRNKVERLHMPFAALKHVADAARTEDRLPTSLREVVTAGEQLQVTDAVRELFSRLPGSTLHNQYGASETHVVCAHTLAGDPAEWPAIPPVGKPVSNTQIHLLDSRMEPVPVGVAGEVYVGGTSPARGYVNDPALTAEKFVPNPFSSEPGARLYKTGDLARYRADGTIEYLGRADNQVKIRGFRIELGDIETALVKHPEVRDAAVVVRENAQGTKRLVAYVVSVPPAVAGGFTAKDAKEVSTVRSSGRVSSENSSLITHHSSQSSNSSFILHPSSFLRALLPEYMIPSAFVALDKLPINANGKLDQAALPDPPEERPADAGEFIAPRNETELKIAETWQSVLGIPLVGAEDDFFRLGGHSLQATQVVSRLREAFHVQIPLRTLFEKPTVAALAQVVAGMKPDESATVRPAIRAVSREAYRKKGSGFGVQGSG